MELNDNKKINIEIANNSQNFIPVPIPKNPPNPNHVFPKMLTSK